MLERIKEAVTETFGEKCADFDANCHGCQAWAEIERLDCPPLSGQPAVTDMKQLLEQGDRAHAALCRELRIQTSLVGGLTAALRRALSDAPAREVTVREAARGMLSAYDLSISGRPITDEQRAAGRYIALAASFAADAYNKGYCEGQDVHALCKAFLTALADPLSPDLDYLRADPAAGQVARDARALSQGGEG
jgi:hypothetical protein